MIKVMVADYDINNLKNFKSYIRKNFSAFNIVKSSMTLEELSYDIKKKRPDLVIVDIKLLGQNIIQLMKDWHYNFENTKFILYGTYNDTEYMKKCMEYGVISYMYKPVRPLELKRCLDSAVNIFKKEQIIDREQEALLKKYSEQMLVFETKFFNNLMSGYLTNEVEIFDGMEYFNVNLYSPYIVALIRVDHFKKIVLTMDEREKHLFIFNILNIVERELSDNHCCKAFINHFNEIALIIGGINDFEVILELMRKVKEKICTSINLGVSIGIGRLHEKVSDIYVSFNEANSALRYRCFIGYNSIISLDYVEPNNHITYRYPLEREELLVYTATIGEFDYCKKLLKELCGALKKCRELPNKLLTQIVTDILISINRNAMEQGLDVKGITSFFPSSDVFKINTVDEAEEYLKKGLEGFCKYILVLRKEKEDLILNKVVEYIHNYYFEGLTVKKTADMFNYSVEYLKKIFKEKMNMNFTEYLNKVRVEAAKTLIEENNFPDEVLALKVGYDDVKIFKSMFKKYVGMTTLEYRHNL